MVRYLHLGTVLFIFFCGGKAFTQILGDSAHAFDLPDESQIANEIFLKTTEDNFAEQLQFIADDLERMSLASSHSRLLIRSRVVLDPEASEEDVYQSGSYRGSPVKTVSRIIAKNDDVLFSLTQAKAAGEPLFFDHLSGCFALRRSVAITEDVSLAKSVLGDYSLSFGNGLLFSNGYNLFPSREVNNNVVPRSNGIKPYISSSSFLYFRGAAAELHSGIFSVSGFFSDRMIDATIDSNTITSLYNSGYHRSASELERREQAQTKLSGGHISITPFLDEGLLEIGATGYSLTYDKQVIKDSLSQGFSGKDHAMISAEIRTEFSFFSASGEYARMISDAGNANAFAASLLAAPLPFWEMSLNFRALAVNFISPFGGTFGINSQDA